MDYLQEMRKIFNDQSDMALASYAEGSPDVRLVSFCTDGKNDGVLYFSTFPDSAKVKEFEKSPAAAIATIPNGDSRHVRAQHCKVVKSELNIFDLQDSFTAKKADYAEIIKKVGKFLVVYEVHFDTALVTLDMQNSGTVTL